MGEGCLIFSVSVGIHVRMLNKVKICLVQLTICRVNAISHDKVGHTVVDTKNEVRLHENLSYKARAREFAVSQTCPRPSGAFCEWLAVWLFCRVLSAA